MLLLVVIVCYCVVGEVEVENGIPYQFATYGRKSAEHKEVSKMCTVCSRKIQTHDSNYPNLHQLTPTCTRVSVTRTHLVSRLNSFRIIAHLLPLSSLRLHPLLKVSQFIFSVSSVLSPFFLTMGEFLLTVPVFVFLLSGRCFTCTSACRRCPGRLLIFCFLFHQFRSTAFLLVPSCHCYLCRCRRGRCFCCRRGGWQ